MPADGNTSAMPEQATNANTSPRTGANANVNTSPNTGASAHASTSVHTGANAIAYTGANADTFHDVDSSNASKGVAKVLQPAVKHVSAIFPKGSSAPHR